MAGAVEAAEVQDTEAARLLLTVPEVAKMLHVSPSTAWKLVYDGDLDSLKIGAARRVPADAVDDFVQRQRAAAS